MAASQAKRRPSFLWQGVLIVLPLAVLSVVAFYSLRQDRIRAQLEAGERAQTLAETLGLRVWAELAEAPDAAGHSRRVFEISTAGQLRFPPPEATLPSPHPLAVRELPPEQARLWAAAQKAEALGTDPQVAVEAWGAFLGSGPPPDFAAAGQYAEALAFAQASNQVAAARAFESLITNYPGAIGESGVPLLPLAELKLLELEMHDATRAQMGSERLLETLCSNAVSHPNSISPYLLKRTRELAVTSDGQKMVQQWQQRWQEQQSLRRLFEAARPHLPTSTPFWFTLDDPQAALERVNPTPPQAVNAPGPAPIEPNWTVTAGLEGLYLSEVKPGWPVPRDWIAIPLPAGTGTTRVICRSEAEVGAALSALVNRTRQFPEYFGAAIEVAGKRVAQLAPDLRLWQNTRYMTKGGGQEKKENLGQVATNLLASASEPPTGAEALKVQIFLTSPSTLFEQQRARTAWVGLLIAAAAIGACVGLSAAWRAFRRQERLAELKTNFVSSVSHELRAPIASVRLLAESLERGKIANGPKQQEYFHFIVQECRRLSALIENVLDFSRIEQGRKQYEFEPTDLLALTRQTVALMENYAAERGLKLELVLPELPGEFGPLQLLADGKALQQALVNLIDNALKHSPRDATVTVGLEVRNGGLRPMPASGSVGRAAAAFKERGSRGGTTHLVTSEPAEGAGCPGNGSSVAHLRLWVEDHGEGIPPCEQEKIFERFYRCGSELRRETQGVGIGLSIVKHIVEAHGGQVVVDSDAGQGSCFTIELPMSNSEATITSEPRL